MSPVRTPLASTNPTRLLVSIRSRKEAELALSRGVDWIDLKEPKSGALGRPSFDLALEIHSILSNHSSRSVALGELQYLMANEAAYDEAIQIAELFPVAKVGLSNLEHENWPSALQKLQQDIGLHRCQLVPVFYADGKAHRAPNWSSLMRYWDDQHSASDAFTHGRILVDTFQKDGRSLLEHLPIGTIQACLNDCRHRNTTLVLAGSLRAEQISSLLDLGAEAIGVRGAVCVSEEASTEECIPQEHNHQYSSSENARMGTLSREKLDSLVRLFATNTPQCTEGQVASTPM